MAVIAGDLVTRLGVDGRKFQSGLDRARGDARSFASDVTRIVSGIAIADIGKSIATNLFGVARASVQLAADTETASVQFKVLTGSAETAAKVMNEINKFAAETPFESMEITQAAKQLLSFGGNANTVIGELKTLGELSSGMGIPLGELAEIYGKARIQGRLFMEDINQLQGRGINISAELAKEFGNVRKAVEKGQVNFGHLERALKAMTTEGGAFSGMMVEMSKTLDGQMSTLVDNVKAVGRSIGESILPELTNIVSETNSVLSKFNELPDRIQFIGDVLEAAFDVAFLNIKENWDRLLADMTKGTLTLMRDFGFEMINGPAMQAIEMAAGMAVQPGGPDQGPANLLEAERRLAALVNQIIPDAPFVGPRQQFPFVGPQQQEPVDGAKVKNLVENLWNRVAPIADSAKFGAQGMIDRLKVRAGAAVGTLENMFSGDAAKKTKTEARLAGSMAAGSQEAFSTIFAAMLRRGKDPNVQATEKQTRELKKALKENKPQMMLAMGAVGL